MDDFRKQLDEIDKEMRELFIRRLDVIKDIASYKYENNIAIFDEAREAYIIENNLALIEENYKSYYKNFIENQLKISKDYQKELISKLKNK